MPAALSRNSRQKNTDDVFDAIADSTRRQLLDRLAQGECCVRELARPFGMSRPAVSQHLRALLDAKLITVQRVGRERRYALCPERLKAVYDWVAHYQAFWTEKLANLGAFLDKNK